MALLLLPALVQAQGTLADYQRAESYRSLVSGRVYHSTVVPNWIGESNRFWYRNTIPEGTEFLLVDADRASRRPAFDHEHLARSLAEATGQPVAARKLPFTSFTFSEDGRSIQFVFEGSEWNCNLRSYRCNRVGPAPDRPGPTSGRRSRERRSGERMSPEGTWAAFVRDFDLYIRAVKTGEEFRLSSDGTEELYYTSSIYWSPDEQRLVAMRTRRGEESTVYLIESAPEDQMRPTMRSRSYALPGDVLTVAKPVVFSVENRPPIVVDDGLFADPFQISTVRWSEDSTRFTFKFQQRGEQLARIISVDARTGAPRVVIEEIADTFIDRYNAIMYQARGTDEIIWGSERDGWKHLYLYDGRDGGLENRITSGKWIVRDIERVDEEARQIYFSASGMNPDEDPYFIHYYRIGFDGRGLTELTPDRGNHRVSFAPDHQYFVDVYSSVDQPPVSQLRRASDGGLVMELERADINTLLETGWKMPEPFVARGRDGQTEIWGVIYRPTSFDPSIAYPVIEKIYAGPHSSFVPKTFAAYRSDQALAELGFIVVQIDGMGTANRSKAFHDMAWMNIADAGFPDRIAWLKAAAQRYPYMDISRVGIFGHSAGGQNSTGALLFHPDFYKVAVSSCGCHDNRMDKAVWNEQWMGYPVGPHYEAQSNVTNAHKLKGKLLLVVGELDTNVPPQSTFQVVDALIKARKEFDLLVLPGAGHSAGGDYGERRKRDFFVRHLLGVEPPDWNVVESAGRAGGR
jgi:dipeptidyl aminopeptidase/acylaminoacyl peptidase